MFVLSTMISRYDCVVNHAFNAWLNCQQWFSCVIELSILISFYDCFLNHNFHIRLCQLGIIGTRNKRAEIIAELGGNGCCPPFDYYMYI
jgi:hypothetical protein